MTKGNHDIASTLHLCDDPSDDDPDRLEFLSPPLLARPSRPRAARHAQLRTQAGSCANGRTRARTRTPDTEEEEERE